MTPLDEGLRLVPLEVVVVLAVHSLDEDDVAKPSRRDQPRQLPSSARASAFVATVVP